MRFFEVGGCVRDILIDPKSKIKDVDFAVDMTEDFKDNILVSDLYQVMRAKLMSMGFEEFVDNPEFFTTRMKVPAGHPLRDRTTVADFVMCRSEGAYTDGRHPDWVKIGDIYDDLARRDFTMNAIAKDEDGNFIDPHGGIFDIQNKTIRFVGNPRDRITEDGMRVIRALRFRITKGFKFDLATGTTLVSQYAAECLDRPKVSRETLRDELEKMFAYDSYASIKLLNEFPHILPVIFMKDSLRLSATMKKGYQHASK